MRSNIQADQVRPFARSPALAAFALIMSFLPVAAWGQLSTGDISLEAHWPEAPLRSGSEFAAEIRFRAGEGVYVYKDKIAATWDTAEGVEFLGLDKPETKAIQDVLEPTQMVEVYEGEFAIPARFRVTAEPQSEARLEGKVHYQGCTDIVCYAPGAEPVSFRAQVIEADSPRAPPATDQETDPEGAVPLAERPSMPLGRLAVNLLWAFGIGVLISLTPCVLPMVPVTAAIVSGLGKRNTRGEAFLLTMVYVLGLAIVYAIAGVLASLLGQQVQNWLHSPWVRIPIATVFALLALSMFDVITIQTPEWLARKLRKTPQTPSDDEANVARSPIRVFSAFGMGLVGGVIAGPCVAAPLAGLLAHVAVTANLAYGFWMLFSVAWGMGVLLVIAGTAPSLLPKAGSWMVKVKTLFGFVLLWAVLFFLDVVIGQTVYLFGTAALLVMGSVFLGCFDTLTDESGFWRRLGRAAGIIAVLAALLISLSLFRDSLGLSAAPPAPPPVFQEATPADLDEALGSGQPVALKFSTDYCVLCEALKRRFRADPRVHEALQGVIALEIDAQEHQDVTRRFGVFGVPALRFFGSDGVEREALRSGDQSVDDFLAKVEEIKQEAN